MPVVGACRPRHHCIQRQIHSLFHQFWTTVFVKLSRGPILSGKWRRRDQLTIRCVQHIKEAIFRRLHDHSAIGTVLSEGQISECDLLCGGVVPTITRRRLVVPAISAGISIDGENRRQKQIIAITIRVADVWIPRRAIAHANQHLIIDGVINDRVPCRAATTVGHPSAGITPGIVRQPLQ